jgi:hypothetical protein
MITLEGKELEVKEAQLKFVQSDETRWLRYYIDEETLEKWVKDYPDSSYHGGGAPILKRIEKFPWE